MSAKSRNEDRKVLLNRDLRWGELEDSAVEEQMAMDKAALACGKPVIQ